MSWEFHRHLKFRRVLIVDNGRYQLHLERFSDTEVRTTRHVSPADVQWVLDGVDMLLCFETPYNWDAFKQKRVKTCLIPMYECTPHPLPYAPDLVLAPSLLDLKYYPNATYIPVPIATDRIPFKVRKRAHHFIHNAGHGGLGGRNGTRELVEALRYTNADFKMTIRSQVPLTVRDDRVEVVVQDHENYWELWDEGDVFVFPEKFNGLSLPINEAMCAGMPIMCSNRFPFNAYLPTDIMIPVRKYEKATIAREFDMAVIDPRDIAQTLDEWTGWGIMRLSYESHDLAKRMSWDALLPTYQNAFDKLLSA